MGESQHAAMPGGPRQTAGITSRLIVRHVRSRGGEPAVAAMLERAALPHTLAALENESHWISYDDKVALFEAAAAVLDDPLVARHVGETVLVLRVGLPVKILLRALGSTPQLLRNIARTSPKFSTVARMEALEVAHHSAVVTYQLDDGLRPSRFDCDYTMGLLSQATVLFGLPPAQLVHRQCQVRGADRCVYLMRWERASRLPWRTRSMRIRHLEDRLATLTERSEMLQSTVADLVSDDDVDTVLARIATRAAATVRAPAYLLAVQPDERSPLRVHSDGMEADAADALVAELSSGVGVHRDGMVVADIVSARRHHGWLVAAYPHGLHVFPEEHLLLATYARHAAAALDAATALEEARRRGETATVLLELARRLAGATSPDDVAQRVAEAVPHVVGAPRASVSLWDADGGVLRIRGVHGFPPGLGTALANLTVRPEDVPELDDLLRSPRARLYVASRASATLGAIMHQFDTEAFFATPIVSRGELLGAVFATGDPQRPLTTVDPALTERLAGLADQAATAIDSARLLARQRAMVRRLQESEERVRHQAYHDPLTGLPNALLFHDRLRQAAAGARRHGHRAAVMFLDLDHFKDVNDGLGHHAGDELLRAVAGRLQACVREEDTVARLGGDEFTVLLPHVSSEEDAATVARALVDACRRPFEVEGHDLSVTASVGVALCPDDGEAPDSLLRHADGAMYRAKQRGRNGFELHADGGGAAADRLAASSALRHSLHAGALELRWRAQVHLASGRTVAVEAEPVWTDPSGADVEGDALVGLAHDAGLVLPLATWMVSAAVARVREWTAARLLGLPATVALPARLLEESAAVDELMGLLRAAGRDAARLELAVSGCGSARDPAGLAVAMARLRELGVRLSLDGLGGGSCTVADLRLLPFDAVRLDADLARGAATSARDAAIVDGAVAVAQQLRLEVVATGIETEAQAAVLRELGCDRGVGPALGSSVTAEVARGTLLKPRRRGRWEPTPRR